MKWDKSTLILKYLDKSISDEEEMELKKLMLTGAIDEEEINDFRGIINESSNITLPEFELKAFNSGDIKIEPKIQDVQKAPFHFTKLLKIAALLIAGISVGAIIMYTQIKREDQYIDIETKKGDKIHLTLPGKNEVWLNSQSKLRYSAVFKGTSRIIELTGEAYFQLNSSVNIPVIIQCNETQIVCSESSLNIDNNFETGSVEIEVEKGWVAINSPKLHGRQFIVESGFKGVIEEMIPIWIEQNKNPNYLAWHTGKMNFENTPLKDVTKTLSEVYDVEIDLPRELNYCFVNHRFDNENLDEILKKIGDELNIKIRKNQSAIIITGKPC
ncbi:MAG: FecR family protein [Bacteroidales bacterium]|nr:FecR family protein [Bacteroidales bacterium]MBN2818170.1 FecR family protein [Bacteroidales bacterium]